MKKAELDLKNATKNVGDLRKKLEAMQAETNKLSLKLAQQPTAGGGTKRSSAAEIDNIEAKKLLAEHSSNVRLQEYLTKAVSPYSLLFLCLLFYPVIRYRNLHNLIAT